MTSASPAAKGIETPCIGVCVIESFGFCLGCARTLQEIGDWTALSDSARLSVIEILPARKAALPRETFPPGP